jgi:hypothetical protein
MGVGGAWSSTLCWAVNFDGRRYVVAVAGGHIGNRALACLGRYCVCGLTEYGRWWVACLQPARHDTRKTGEEGWRAS